MFIHPISSPSSLIVKITVSGSYMTLWLKPSNMANGIENFWLPHLTQLNWVEVVKYPSNAKHALFHDGIQSKLGHLHLYFKKMHENRFEDLIDELAILNILPEEEKEAIKQAYQNHIAKQNKLMAALRKINSWNPLAFFLSAFPLRWLVPQMRMNGFFTACLATAVVVFPAVITRVRDQFKEDAYLFVKDHHHRWSAHEKLSYTSGTQAAISTSNQFLCLFNRHTWVHTQAYYAGLTAKQLEDMQLEKDIERPSMQYI